jgi:hypothetical protein
MPPDAAWFAAATWPHCHPRLSVLFHLSLYLTSSSPQLPANARAAALYFSFYATFAS